MEFKKIGNCPACSSPLWIPAVWHGITPPPVTFSCSCVPQPRVVTTTTTTINGMSANNAGEASKALDALTKAFKEEGILQEPPTIKDLAAKVEKLEGMLQQVLQAVEKKKTKKQKLLTD